MAKEKKCTSWLFERSLFSGPRPEVPSLLPNGEYVFDEFGNSKFVYCEPVTPGLAEDFSVEALRLKKGL